MANESLVLSGTIAHPKSAADVSSALTGGTLTSSNVFELKLLKSAFYVAGGTGVDTDAERALHKQNVMAVLEALEQAVIKLTWPPE